MFEVVNYSSLWIIRVDLLSEAANYSRLQIVQVSELFESPNIWVSELFESANDSKSLKSLTGLESDIWLLDLRILEI